MLENGERVNGIHWREGSTSDEFGKELAEKAASI